MRKTIKTLFTILLIILGSVLFIYEVIQMGKETNEAIESCVNNGYSRAFCERGA